VTVDLGGLPAFPDTAALRTDASAVHTAGTAFRTTADEARSTWLEIDAHIAIPGEADVLSAFDGPRDMGQALESSTEVVKLALHQYCDDLDALKGEYDAAVNGAMRCYADPAEAEDAQQAVNAVAQRMAALEKDCADNIRTADPVAVPDAPWAAPQDGMARGAVSTALGQLRVPEFEYRFSATVQVTTLDYSRINIAHADGTIIPSERIVLTQSTIQADLQVRGRAPVVDPTRFNNIPDVPVWARRTAQFIPLVDYGITAYNSFAQEWGDDLDQHPEMSTTDRVGSALQSAALRTLGNGIGNIIGGAAGVFGGAVAGGATVGAAGAAAGSVVPVVGTLVGGGAGLAGGAAVGALIGGYAGGTAGGLAGENLGGMLDNWWDGEDTSWGTVWEKVWG
jgi:hypothetical protein